MVSYFSMIDYIIIQSKAKPTLRDARTYSGTELFSDHRLVVSRLDTRPFIVHRKHKRTEGQDKKFDTNRICSDP